MAAQSIVKLSLESAQYEQKLRGAKRQFEDFTNSIGINMKQLTAAGIAIGIATTAINAFTSACSEAITKSVELAKEAEGIKRAFDRIDKPDLLQNLREATHNTVSDLELMKNAVKFDNFNLSLDQMGTFLAFAQQQAKDTGQSVEYMVDSIVTGLGRKSLPILDNLGLSATDIRERMKETGDMTTAVADIIKDRMEAAGGYVETASDRAAQANAKLENSMTRLGETFQPVTDAATSMWTDIKVGALDLINSAIQPLIDKFTELGRARAAYEGQSGDERVNRQLDRLKSIQTDTYKRGTYKAQLANYDTAIASHEQYLKDYKTWQSDNTAVGAYDRMQAFQKQTGLEWVDDVKAHLDAFKRMRAEYVRGAKTIIDGNPAPSHTTTTTTTTGGRSGKTFNPNSIAFNPLDFDESIRTDPDRYFNSPFALADQSALRTYMGFGKKQYDAGRDITKNQTQNQLEEKQDSANLQDITGAVGNMFNCLEQIGIEIPKGFQSVFGVLNTIVAIVGAIQAMQEIGTFLGLFANGGVARAANGIVPGRSFSGDNIPALLNSGETVLTRAQSSNLMSALNNGGLGNLQLETILYGEDIKIAINNSGRRDRSGTIVTSNMRRI